MSDGIIRLCRAHDPGRVHPSGRVVTEWEVSHAEHMAIAAAGPDITIRVRVHTITQFKPLQPLRVELVVLPNPPVESIPVKEG